SVSVVAARVILGVAVEDFAVITRFRDADTIVFAGYGREVCYYDQIILGISGATDKGKDARVRVVTIDPLKSLPVEIDLVQCRFTAIDRVQVDHELLNAPMFGESEQIPFKAGTVVPLGTLRELSA